MCKTSVYKKSGKTPVFGEGKGGIDIRLGDPPEPREFNMKAGICVRCDITVTATSAPAADRKVRELLEMEDAIKIDGFETMLMEFEFVEESNE